MTPSGSIRKTQKSYLSNVVIISVLAWFLPVSCQDEECPPANRPKTLDAVAGRYKVFMTPGFYRGVYQPNMDCHWIIRSTEPGAWLQLIIHSSQFEDRLFTECDDYVELRDGSTSQSPLLLKWCGFFNPSAFSSISDALYLRFHSDQFYQVGRGLNMSYISYPRPGCPPGWKESASTGNCYHLVSPQPPFPKMSWVDAQKRCSYERSNLLTVTSDEERTMVVDFYGSTSEQAWVGITDAQEEGHFVSVDPNTKLYPDPFRTSKNDEGRDCVYMDLKTGGPGMYDVDDCRAERSYLCQRRKDGSTVPYPPPESIIRQGLVAAAGVSWNSAYLWIIGLVVLILILLICAPWIRKRYKEYKNNQVAAQSENDSRNILIRNNAVTNNDTTGAGGQRMPPSSNLILGHDVPSPEKKLVESAAVKSAPGSAGSSSSDSGALTYRKLTAGNGHLYPGDSNDAQPNGYVRDGVTKQKHIFTVPPVEKFDRPVIRPLDNVSAISLDEYWHRIEVERIRKIDVRESPPSGT